MNKPSYKKMRDGRGVLVVAVMQLLVAFALLGLYESYKVKYVNQTIADSRARRKKWRERELEHDRENRAAGVVNGTALAADGPAHAQPVSVPSQNASEAPASAPDDDPFYDLYEDYFDGVLRPSANVAAPTLCSRHQT